MPNFYTKMLIAINANQPHRTNQAIRLFYYKRYFDFLINKIKHKPGDRKSHNGGNLFQSPFELAAL